MSFQSNSRFQEAIAAFDALNAQDPNTVTDADGASQPKELHDALAMSAWLERLYPDASEAAHLAARCQHLCRWEVPRNSYPEGRAGYLKWRSDLKQVHADKSADVLSKVGYGAELIDAVVAINLKKGLKSNPDVQAIEDVLCLVFLDEQFEDYIDVWDEEKIVRILQKTWSKMSGVGHAAALQLPLSERALSLVKTALGEQ
ncbi:MAG: DUF4202 domain-containing protein [Coraliomargarita sp.]